MSDMMLAAVLERPGQLALLRVPVPGLEPGEVLIQVGACGVCGSDLRYLQGENPWALQTLGSTRPNLPNMVLGHEVAGTIVQAGPGAAQSRVGERVVLLAYQACGVCPECRRGDHHLCEHVTHHGHGAGWRDRESNPGGLAEYCPVDGRHALRLPDSISFEQATLLDGLAVAVHAVDMAGLRSADQVAVVGSGPIGLCIAQVAAVAGAVSVFSIDVAKGPCAAASSLGFQAIQADASNAAQDVLDATDGNGVAAVFDTVGTAESRRAGLSMLRRGGRLLCLAGREEALGVPYAALTGERAVGTVANSPYPDLSRAIRLAATGAVDLEPLITHRFPLDQVERAFEAARDRQASGALKVVVQPAVSD